MGKDYSSQVPRTIRKNLEFRRMLLTDAHKDERLQRAIRRACEWSCSFWVNCFVWTYDPRKVDTIKLPMVTWRYQDEAFESLHKSIIGQSDVLIEKSRDMGASWICLLKILHCWLYLPNSTFLMMSRVAKLVDAPSEPDSLFWKMDFVIKNMPSWLIPKHNRTFMRYENLETGCTINGVTSTGDGVVGGRRTAAFFDEFPKMDEARDVWVQSADMANCRIFNGTPNGTNNTFYELTKMPHIKKLRFHWSAHPEKAKGLYYDAMGKPRSPWYDAECIRRGNNRQEIASQLDIDYTGSTYQFFDGAEISRLKSLWACEPYHIGEIDHGKYVEVTGGYLRLWTHLQGDVPPPDKYVIGCDIAQGTGGPNATPSCASVFNRTTGHKVAEYAISGVSPSGFADKLKQLGMWFYGAQIIWEHTGPGDAFGQRLLALRYPSLYIRRNEKKIGKERMDMYGWHPSPESKDTMLEHYRRALTAGEFINHSALAMDECMQMQFGPSGHVSHTLSLAKNGDPSMAKANHADRVIADALSWKLAEEYGTPDKEEVSDDPEQGSFAWRRSQREKAAKHRSYWPTRRTG